MDVFGWLHAFVSWLRDRVGKEDEAPPWIEQHFSADEACELRLLQDENTSNGFPGVVSVWMLIHYTSASNDLIIILANIAQMRESLGKQGGMSDRDIWKRAFEQKAKQALKQQDHINGSHLFITGWLTKAAVKERFIEGKLHKFRHLDPGVCYVVNLQSMLDPPGVNKPARRVVEAIARRLLNVTPSQYSTWEEIVRLLDTNSGEGKDQNWLNWLEFFAIEFRATRLPQKDHVLRPVRAKRPPRTK